MILPHNYTLMGIPDKKPYILLGTNFLSQYYSIFDASSQANIFLGLSPSNQKATTIDPDALVLVIIASVAAALLGTGCCCCCCCGKPCKLFKARRHKNRAQKEEENEPLNNQPTLNSEQSPHHLSFTVSCVDTDSNAGSQYLKPGQKKENKRTWYAMIAR